MLLLDHPLALFVVTFLLLWLAAWIGMVLHSRRHDLPESVREDYGTIVGATLTLLGLLIGFTFSMATTRYDQRKNLEEEEANALGTEYARLDFLPTADAGRDVHFAYREQRKHRVQVQSESATPRTRDAQCAPV